ncbi:hypothetical protein SK128_017617 [Halocaridina rubra]|uniref:Uncharacterized protein n=1 Tax=Halocaridina rubra TaxID=373956 RepID=A0AAN9AGE8_HALRR
MGCNQRLQTKLVTQANLTLAAINNFKDAYAWRKFNLSWNDTCTILSDTMDHHFLLVCDESECLRVLPNLPMGPVLPPITTHHARDLLADLLQYAQQYAYALEIMFLDQSLHEDTFQAHVDEIYRQMEGLVTSLHYGLHQCQVSPREMHIRRLLGKVYKGADTTMRDERGFRTLRQCYLGIQYIRQVFSTNEIYTLFS